MNRRPQLLLVLAIVAPCLAGTAGAIQPKDGGGDLAARAFVAPRTSVLADVEAFESARSIAGAALGQRVDDFRALAADGAQWQAEVDRRTGHVTYAEGGGIPWVAGRGNRLKARPSAAVDLAAMEAVAREFLPSVASMLGLEGAELRLNHGRSGQPAAHVWFVDFDVVRNGRAVEGARVVFRVNNGNLIQFGTENLPPAGARAPEQRLGRAAARRALADLIGGFQPQDRWLDKGSLHLIPVNVDDPGTTDGYRFGEGRGLALVWQFTFHRPGEVGTFRGRVDATTGEVLELTDINEYGSVTGGAYAGDRPIAEAVVPMPWANVASGVYANSAGLFSGTTGTTSLNGQYVGISDSCGSISKAASSGVIALGSGGGTDCTTPGSGGSGNTHAARTQFYMVNRAKEVGRGWLPSNSWLNGKLTVNVNLNQTCNAYWNGSSINFFRSGGGCANTGELPGVSLHEYGHGLDSNDGSGSSADNGTGETYGDFTAALATHTSCVGNGFLSSNCGGYGNSCTSCTGVRDIDWAKHSRNTPSTVANFTQTTCPQPSANNPNYVGPCGKDAIARGQTSKKREGHCESYVSSEAMWDLAARDLPTPGTGAAWSIADRLWYLSRSTATKGFQCNVSGTTWTSDGCIAGSYFRTMRAVDDDNGNLNDGTPHGGAIAAAFNRHGIACTTDTAWNTTHAGVTPPATPALSATGGNDSAALAWSGSSGVYDIYRNERGCNAGFTKVANDVSGSGYNDTAVANGFTYYYQVTAQPSGNEAAASAPSTCRSVTPAGAACTPPGVPGGVSASASGTSQVNVSWSAVSGASEYHVYRGTTSGGPYSSVGTAAGTSFSDTGLACGTSYYYVVRAANSASCESGNSAQAQASTGACNNTLQNGVGVGISGATGSQQLWTMSVPAGATNLKFTTAGGSGDLDLYVRFGAAPTTSTYDCRSWTSTNAETCNISSAQVGTYHVLVNGYAAFSGATLTGSYTAGSTNVAPTANFTFTTSNLTATFTDSSTDTDGTIASWAWNFGDGTTSTTRHPVKTYGSAGTRTVTLTVTDDDGATNSTSRSVAVSEPSTSVLSNGVPVTGLSGATGNQRFFTMEVPAGATNLKFVTSGGSGDMDLYVRFGSAPTTSTYTCRSWNSGNSETCNISSAQAGTYHVLLYAYSTYSGASLTGSFTAGSTNVAPNASYSFTTSGLTATFTDTSTDADGTVTSWSWNFGDGTTSTTRNPAKTYASAGTRTVVLTVTDDDGATDSVSQSVTVSTGPSAPCTGCTLYTGTLSNGGSQWQPNGTYYQSTVSGSHQGWLEGPSGTDFDLELHKWSGSSWTRVARSISSTSEEQISYSGTAGYYMWKVVSYSGSGAYSFWLKKP